MEPKQPKQPLDCFMDCTPVAGSNERFYVMALQELTIYGHTVDAWVKENYPEDWSHIVAGRKNGLEWGCFHSVASPDGEIGTNDVSQLMPISEDAFFQARENSWPLVPFITSLAPAAAVYTVDEQGNYSKVWDSLGGDAK